MLKKYKVVNLASYRRKPEFYFKVGMKYVEKGQFKIALKYLDMAVRIEPHNPEYQFNLACVLAELREIEKSNTILFNILRNIDPTFKECYFGIGCNYFDMGNFKMSREYFEKYIYFDPAGQYIDEVYDILYYLQIYDDVGLNIKKSKNVSKLINEGRRYLDEKDYKKASTRLEKVIEINPELISPRNDLSLVYFARGDLSMAISLAKSVLKIDPCDIEAHCNLTLFYTYLGDSTLYNKQLKALSELKVSDKRELLKLLYTYIKLKKHENIVRLLEDYDEGDMDFALFHILAVAFYNLKQFDNSDDIWNMMRSIFPQHNLIIDYYSLVNLETKNMVRAYEEMEYSDVLPEDLDSIYQGSLIQYLKMELRPFNESWENDKLFRDIVLYNLYKGSTENKEKIISKFLQTGSNEVNEMLKSFMENISQNFENIPTAIGRLKKDDILLKDKIYDESKPLKKCVPKIQVKWKREWEAVIDCALQNREYTYSQTYRSELKNMWMDFIRRVYPEKIPVIRKREAWAAALEYLYCNLHLIYTSKRKLAEKYKISTSSITNRLKDLIE